MRGLISRVLRSEILMAAAVLFAFALPVHAAHQGIRTFTQMTVQTHKVAGVTVSEFTVHVTSSDGLALTGAVTLEEDDRPLVGAALEEGIATLTPSLSPGSHQITAVYQGDGLHKLSTSAPQAVSAFQPEVITPTYAISMNPAALSLTAGQAGDSIVSITPTNNQGTTTPTFFTISCSGLPADTSCYFTPQNVQIPAGSNAVVTSSFTLQTMGQSGSLSKPAIKGNKSTIALAILLPGILAIGWLGRRRSSMIRLMMLALIVLVASLGFTGCAPLYNYHNHGPPNNVPTPSGTYTITVTAQTNNGVTASNITTTFALTVK